MSAQTKDRTLEPADERATLVHHAVPVVLARLPFGTAVPFSPCSACSSWQHRRACAAQACTRVSTGSRLYNRSPTAPVAFSGLLMLAEHRHELWDSPAHTQISSAPLPGSAAKSPRRATRSASVYDQSSGSFRPSYLGFQLPLDSAPSAPQENGPPGAACRPHAPFTALPARSLRFSAVYPGARAR
ncbi:hypothetical protein BDV93DRAFT_601971 [Ceratobasidium sp. AG-I]|nr:hypothetical protein BDV93DRAFT_601971 [Ceratobasidium sp. AG-I]